MNEEKYLGFIKFEGYLVEDGLMDARKQAEALLGIDFALRHFISKQAPQFKELEFEIPVRVRKGSWEALIPETVGGWVQAGLGVVATAYFAKAAQKMAEKDFADFGFTDLFRKSLELIKWFVKIGKHVGDLSIRTFQNTTFQEDGALIGISNSNGEILYVPKYVLDIYVQTTPRLLERIVALIQEGRELSIGTIDGKLIDEVKVLAEDKIIFSEEEPDQDENILFPEMVHGEPVVLKGDVTRENKMSNSMGFKYKDHILTAYPESGSIIPFKPLLFLKCRLFGTVSRLDEKGKIAAKRPKIYFSHLEPLEENDNLDLLT